MAARAARQAPVEMPIDHEAMDRARVMAERFSWFVVVGKDGPLNARGRCHFKQPDAAQLALEHWPEAIGCYAPDGKFYRK